MREGDMFMPSGKKEFNPDTLQAIIDCFPNGKKQFCDFSDMSYCSTRNYLIGSHFPSEYRLRALAKLFRIDVSAFYSQRGSIEFKIMVDQVVDTIRDHYERFEMEKGAKMGDSSMFSEYLKWQDMEVPYPYNMLDAICKCHVDTVLSEDMENGLECALETLTDREVDVLHKRYKEYMTLRDIGKALNVTSERVRQIEAKALRKLRHPSRMKYFKFGMTGIEEFASLEALNAEIDYKKRFIEELESEIQELMREKKKVERLLNEYGERINEKEIDYRKMSIEAMDLSVRSFNCLRRANIRTVGELIERAKDEESMYRIRNLGRRSIQEIYDKLMELYNIDPRAEEVA